MNKQEYEKIKFESWIEFCKEHPIETPSMSIGEAFDFAFDLAYKLGKQEKPTEPKENIAEIRNLSKDCDKQFDNILKDSFSKERKLNIATQIMSSILSNQKMLNNLAHGETTVDGVVKCIVNTTMMYTDALLAECNSPKN